MCSGQRAKMSLVVKRSISLGGRKTSVTLEDEFWNALRVITQRDKTTLVSLVHQINQTRNQSNLSSAIRVFVLKRSTIVMDQEKEKPVHSIGAAA
jgi:predicted DNA-binding ribbon-helix-helix protein